MYSSRPITGGYIARNRLRMNLFAGVAKENESVEEESALLEEVDRRISCIDDFIRDVQSLVGKSETKTIRSHLLLDQALKSIAINQSVKSHLKSSGCLLQNLERAVQKKKELQNSIEASLKSNEAKMLALNQEFGQVTKCFIQSSANY